MVVKLNILFHRTEHCGEHFELLRAVKLHNEELHNSYTFPNIIN
jgi:hypothetical protein